MIQTASWSEFLAQPARTFLNVGCGTTPRDRLPGFFRTVQWQEIRYDIDPDVKPDIVGSIVDMAAIASGSVDALWSSHNLEHLNSFEVPQALAEFRRILKPDGFAVISLPNLRAIAELIAHGKLEDILYVSAAGPIRPLDILFGHQAAIRAGKQHMAHRTGFTADSLGLALSAAGFEEVRVQERESWDLWAVATMPDTDAAIFDGLAGR